MQELDTYDRSLPLEVPWRLLAVVEAGVPWRELRVFEERTGG